MSKMTIHALFIQRKESYDGQFAPECLLAWDEFCIEENEDGFEQQCKKALAACGDDVRASAIIEIRVDQNAIRDKLVGKLMLEGEVLP